MLPITSTPEIVDLTQDRPLEVVKSYLRLADNFYCGSLTAVNLKPSVALLSAPDQALLEVLFDQAIKVSSHKPRYSWAITTIADAATTYHSTDLFSQALTAWWLSRTANWYYRPDLASKAVERAYTLFSALKEPGWVAACVWQRNSIPWTRPSFSIAVKELEIAMAQLQISGAEFSSFLPHCRLALAHVQLLLGEFDEAYKNIQVSAAIFQAQGDQLNFARCLYTRSAGLRRQSHYEEAIATTTEALTIFQESLALVDVAKTKYQMALHQALALADYRIAEENLLQAINQFTTLDLPLWSAQCHHSLAQICNMTGRLHEAKNLLQLSRDCFVTYNTLGLLADNLLDSGWLEMLYGNYTESLNYLVRAMEIGNDIGNPWLQAATLMHQGEVYIFLGQYQQALYNLETAIEHFQKLGSVGRIAECEMRLAKCWVELGLLEKAEESLERAVECARQSNQLVFSVYLYKYRAEIALRNGQAVAAVSNLQVGLDLALQLAIPKEVALIQYFLAKAFCELKEAYKAYEYIQTAEQAFTSMGMIMEKAACKIIVGYCHIQIGNREAAQIAWNEALSITQGIMPDISWQAFVGLAKLAESVNDNMLALTLYVEALNELKLLRQGFWQPELAGAFFDHSGSVFDRAISIATHIDSNSQVLRFIEESKAQTIVRQFQFSPSSKLSKPASQPLNDLIANIRWLQDQLRANYRPRGFLQSPDQLRLRKELQTRVKQYSALRGRIERQTQTKLQGTIIDEFNLDEFRQLAVGYLGENWLAVDYYLTNDQIFGILITPSNCQVFSCYFSGRVEIALNSCFRLKGHQVTTSDLIVLGDFLFPETIRHFFTPDITLIIAPHRHLHSIPWAALPLPESNEPLVATVVPLIVPSLYSLSLLWQRSKTKHSHLNRGLLVTVSNFQGHHSVLPAVLEEASVILKEMAGQTEVEELRDSVATWANIQQLTNEQGLNRYDWLHIASHAFHDSLTGRLSGFALYDKDVWLDDLWNIAPLPAIVTLSACGGGSLNRIHDGDEHISLVTTCLVAGTQNVIASLWPVLDVGTVDLIIQFYHQLSIGRMPSQALAFAQRTLWKQGVIWSQWGGFHCIGAG